MNRFEEKAMMDLERIKAWRQALEDQKFIEQEEWRLKEEWEKERVAK